MVNKNKKSVLISILALVMTLCLSLSLSVNTVFAAEDAKTVYEENKTLVAVIDKGDYFTELYNLALEDATYLSVMQSVVKVAKAYNELENTFPADSYEQKDYDEMVKVLNLTKNYVSLTSENYLTYNKKEAAYLERIADETQYLFINYDTKLTKLDDYLTETCNAIDGKYDVLSATNKANPDGAANQVVGLYDDEGLAELEAVHDAFIDEANSVKLDTADVNGTKAALDDVKQRAFDAMHGVRKNKVERANDKLQDYYAAAAGNLDADPEALKQEATDAINDCEDFWEGASKAVLKEYSSEKKAFEDFFDENLIDDSAYKNKAVLETEDGSVMLEATIDGELVEIFPADAKLNVYNIIATSPKRYNAQREILKSNDQISIAYFIDVLVYLDSAVWDAPTELEGKQVVYQITIDLNAYYTNYVENNESFIASLLKNIGIKSAATENKFDFIKAVAESENDQKDLCYIYYKDGEEAAVKSLECSLSGGILMFKTNMLGSVAINGNENASLLTNPVFWVGLILALVLLIVIIVLVFKFINYCIKFYLSDGTLIAVVKARKGESFVMPVAPKKKGHVFAGWFEDAELKNRFLQTQITKRKNFSVYAKYIKELSGTQLTDYFNNICVKLASNGILGDEYETEAETLKLAKVEKLSDSIKLYLAMDTETIDKVYGVSAAKVEGIDKAALKVIDTTEAYDKALELIDALIEQYKLQESDLDVDEFSGKDTYLFTVAKYVAPVVEETEEIVEATEEQAALPVGPTDEQLTNYLRELRKQALSYALTVDNEKAQAGKMLIKAYKAEDGIYLYFALDAEAYGLAKAEGDNVTPAMFVVTNDEEFAKAQELISAIMAEYGLEKVINPSELSEGSGRGFGYRIKKDEETPAPVAAPVAETAPVAAASEAKKQEDDYARTKEIIDMIMAEYGLEKAEKQPAPAPVVVAPVPVPSEEEPVDYLAELRKEALSYALMQENEKAKDGMMLVKAYKQEDGVYLYLALEADKYGLANAEGTLAVGTPAMFVVANEEELAKGKELIATVMTEYGLEKVVDASELPQGSSKGFSYKIKFNG